MPTSPATYCDIYKHESHPIVTPRSRRQPVSPPQPSAAPASSPAISADAALSFLKDTKGALTWTAQDLGSILNITRRQDAQQVIDVLEAQGYAKRAGTSGEWMATPAGESVSGAKPPRFSRESVLEALSSLKERIKQANNDPKVLFKITTVVAFGDFLLTDRARVQAADLGVALTRKDPSLRELRSASEARAKRQFLTQLRGRTAVLQLRPYADWMSKRTHLKLL
jgi:hypothetical protein